MKYLIVLLILFIIIIVLLNCKTTKDNFSNNKKFMIFTSLGDKTNFHNNWISKNQNYDIYAIYYGDNDEKYNFYKKYVKYIEKRKGSKYQNFKYMWDKYNNMINMYNRYFLIDDDIIFDKPEDINELFNISEKYDSWILSPTFKGDGSSKISHQISKQQIGNYFRYVNFIENGVTLFSNYSINKFMKYYDSSLFGWGIDYFYIWVLGQDVKDKFIYVDSISVINPHDNTKDNQREWSKLKGANKEQDYWDNVKKYKIVEWKHNTFKTVKNIQIKNFENKNLFNYNRFISDLKKYKNKKKYVLIFTGGPTLKEFKKNQISKEIYDNSYIIAVKNSINFLDKIGVKPDFFISNFNSSAQRIDTKILEKYKMIKITSTYKGEPEIPELKEYFDYIINIKLKKILWNLLPKIKKV